MTAEILSPDRPTKGSPWHREGGELCSAWNCTANGNVLAHFLTSPGEQRMNSFCLKKKTCHNGCGVWPKTIRTDTAGRGQWQNGETAGEEGDNHPRVSGSLTLPSRDVLGSSNTCILLPSWDMPSKSLVWHCPVKRQQEKHRGVTVGHAPVLTAGESKQEQVTLCPVPPASLSARVLLDPSHSRGTELAPHWSPARDAKPLPLSPSHLPVDRDRHSRGDTSTPEQTAQSELTSHLTPLSSGEILSS